MAGGYIYEQVDLGYNQSTNGATVRSWALAIHRARCEAFIKAVVREYNYFGGNDWYSVQTGLYNEFSEWIDSKDVWIQDIHPASVDTGEQYPAFVTFFKNNGTGAEYCILTYSGFNAYDSYSDPTAYYNYGLYIPKANLQRGANNTTHACCGSDMSHAFARSGFANYDVCSSSFLSLGACTHIMTTASMKSEASASTYIRSTDSLVGCRAQNGASDSDLVGKTYQFGFAIKGTQIAAFMRRSDADGWLWSVIGEIFDVLIDPNDTHKVGCITHDYYSGSMSEISTNHNVIVGNSTSVDGRVSFCTNAGVPFKSTNTSIRTEYTRSLENLGINPCARTDNTIPSDTRYNAVAVGSCYNSFTNTSSNSGVDGNGNGCKGFIDTNLLRQVSGGVCQSVGSTFQAGNFVCMKASSSNQYGFILGWDPSNISIM